MEVLVNSKNIYVPPKITVLELLEYLESAKSVAVFVNGKQILMREYSVYKLMDKDEIKIIKPLGGG